MCRSRDRSEKEKAMHQRFEQRIDTALGKLKTSCEKRRYKKETIDRRVGSIMAKNSRGAGLYNVQVKETNAGTSIHWSKNNNGVPGLNSTKAVTCFVQMSRIGPQRIYGKPISS